MAKPDYDYEDDEGAYNNYDNEEMGDDGIEVPQTNANQPDIEADVNGVDADAYGAERDILQDQNDNDGYAFDDDQPPPVNERAGAPAATGGDYVGQYEDNDPEPDMEMEKTYIAQDPNQQVMSQTLAERYEPESPTDEEMQADGLDEEQQAAVRQENMILANSMQDFQEENARQNVKIDDEEYNEREDGRQGTEPLFSPQVDKKEDEDDDKKKKRKAAAFVMICCCLLVLLLLLLGLVFRQNETPTDGAQSARPDEYETASPSAAISPTVFVAPTRNPTPEPTTKAPTTKAPTTDSPVGNDPTEKPTPEPTGFPTTKAPSRSPTPFTSTFPTIEPLAPSRLPCNEIRVDENVTAGNRGENNFRNYTFGDKEICGDTFGGPDSTYPGRNYWSVAFGRRDCVMRGFQEGTDVCQQVGARRCSLDELLANVAQGTGCGGDFTLLYSGSSCETPSGKTGVYMFNVGFNTTKQPYISCESNLDYPSLIRCCGDNYLVK